MTTDDFADVEEPPVKRHLVIEKMERVEAKSTLEVAIEQSDNDAEIEVTTHPPSVQVTDSGGEVARIPLDDELRLDI